MACCSLSFPVTAKPKSPSSTSGAVAVSPSSYYSSSRSTLHSQLLLSSCGIYHGPSLSLHYDETLISRRLSRRPPNFLVVSSGSKLEPLKVMISGAPASGKGTQCQVITEKYGLVHIAAGDLLRAEISAGSENGRQAKEYMEKGQLVPNEIVVKVPEENLVERVVGRRLDPVTGRTYHLKFSPPESEEIAARLTQRFDDTEEKVKLRLQTHHQNVESVLSMYEDITVKVNGNVSKEDVFAQIDSVLTKLLEQKKATMGSMAA